MSKGFAINHGNMKINLIVPLGEKYLVLLLFMQPLKRQHDHSCNQHCTFNVQYSKTNEPKTSVQTDVISNN